MTELTLKQQLRGAKLALKSPRTPKQLKPGIKRLIARLEKRIEEQRGKPKPPNDLIHRMFGW